MIIGVSGKIGSGKTTFCNVCKELLEEKGYKVKIINFADKLRQVCYVLTGYYGYTQEEKNLFLPEWNMTVGEILQKTGTDAMRNNFDKDVWVKSTFSSLEKDTVYLIGDCRFKNEADSIRNYGGLLVRMNGDPMKIRENSLRDLNHVSETELDSYNYWDLYIVNQNISIDDIKIYTNAFLDLNLKKINK